MGEPEVIDRYNQRVDVCKDDESRAIFAYNHDEKNEHAEMVIELIRRRDPGFDKGLKDYLFAENR